MSKSLAFKSRRDYLKVPEVFHGDMKRVWYDDSCKCLLPAGERCDADVVASTAEGPLPFDKSQLISRSHHDGVRDYE